MAAASVDEALACWAALMLVNGYAPARNSARRLGWKRSIFPIVVGLRGWVSRCSMPFCRQIASKSPSTGGWLKRPVNTLPLSVKIYTGTP